MTILINSQSPNPPVVDPGVLLLDSFMTEEQEQAILDEIDREMSEESFRSLGGSKACLNATRLEGTAAWNRLRRFTLRSSTALVSDGLVQFWSRCRQAAGTCSFAGTAATITPIAASGTVEPSSIPARLPSTPIQ